MKKSSRGSMRILAPLRKTTLPPSAISAGARSPIGEPLAILPPTVPLARTCFEPKRRNNSPKSAWIAPSSGAASSNVIVAPSEPDDALQVAQLLGDPKPDVGRPSDQSRVGKPGVERCKSVNTGRRREEDGLVADEHVFLVGESGESGRPRSRRRRK